MITKVLGKITFAEFGTVKDYPFLMGLLLGFEMDGGHFYIMSGSKYTLNISPNCKWDNDYSRATSITLMVEKVKDILETAKVNYVSELIGKPVEVTVENGTFKDFRILTEVL